MSTCHVCRQPAVTDLLDFGPQPIRNRYLRSPDEAEYVHRLAIGCCGACGLVQLDDPAPADELRPRYDWLAYNEPEGHLDQLVSDITALPGVTAQSVFGGISYKDDSTLRRLRERGFSRTWRVELGADLGIHEPGAGIETIQDRLTAKTAIAMATKHGRPDVVVMRHVLEHAHDTNGLLDALRCLVAPHGYLIFEVPDCQRALERCDYSTAWEEHVFYFTAATLQHSLAQAGFAKVYLRVFPYSDENSLVAIVRAGPASSPKGFPQLTEEIGQADRFLRGFAEQRERYRSYFAAQRRQRGKIAFLGAGHRCGGLLNFFELRTFMEFVADDNPNKKGMFMPGCRLPILGSEELIERDIKLCCMSVRPESEDAVIARNKAFLARGGSLVSIFPDSRYSLPI